MYANRDTLLINTVGGVAVGGGCEINKVSTIGHIGEVE